ncbi:dTDP-4-dehydrorhamnose reductase [Ramlibacter tataouinensis]|uniref:dTDP-4-dehydrorhamnose reductase n=1 Tax=Ramlibacter tataouinensis (strain ATCC BAA-407 / DSM 14655 / LMG 21543 / TTB310) TaxID=365046 RepID=F5XYW3_RAMTT|nr:dTDP-4-dehydrorhamnose reductase [Ramlibacter tataouinensis]AEG91951.1 Candidate dTDP-4-dehydrorhamnose reductase (dTDP-4-keto-L- rhamnose reductase) [Ramlibacter tataouinensis TTB310]
MKILLFGKNGQVGWELQRSLAPLGELVALGSREADLPSNFLEPDRLAETVRRVRPDVIVNAAAYTAVDKAETDQHSAQLVNAVAPGVLAQAANACGAALVHYSTDYVFDGSGAAPRIETEPTAPLNVYGLTKLEGERLIQQHCERHLILRTSWVYGARGGNFAKTMLRLAKERDRLTVVDDQVGAPTGADLLADVTAHALRALVADGGKAGLYHVAAGGETSWHGYARFVIATAQQAGQVLKAGVEAVAPVPSTAFPTPARRPHNSRLDTSRFRAAFDLTLPPWQQGVARMLEEIL